MIGYWLLAQISRGDLTNLPKGDLTSSTVRTGLQMVFGVAGGIALLIVTLGALKYILAQGNPQEVGKAKDTILYAIIGLVVCIMAFTIVTFVTDRV